jgi:hypothetical protein
MTATTTTPGFPVGARVRITGPDGGFSTVFVVVRRHRYGAWLHELVAEWDYGLEQSDPAYRALSVGSYRADELEAV